MVLGQPVLSLDVAGRPQRLGAEPGRLTVQRVTGQGMVQVPQRLAGSAGAQQSAAQAGSGCRQVGAQQGRLVPAGQFSRPASQQGIQAPQEQ